MAVDFYEANLSSNNNNLMFNIGCFQPESPTNLSPSQAPSSQRPHLRLYERQQTTTTTPQSPLDSAFGCWSPISQNEEEPIKWSNGDLLWKNSSSCENSTTSSTDGYDSDPFQQTAQNYPYFQDSFQYGQESAPLNHSNSKWSTNDMWSGVNNENMICQMSKLSLDNNNELKDQAILTPSSRKWSHEDSPKVNAIGHNSVYAPYMPTNDCHFITPSVGKWSTAQDSQIQYAPHVTNNSVKPHQQLYSHQSLPGRQIFAQLNPHLTQSRRKGPNMTCTEAEIQQLNQQIESQQRIYAQLYQKLMSGELKQSSNAQQNDFNSLSRPATFERQSSSSSTNQIIEEFETCLNQCDEQYRELEKARKKTEAELVKPNLGLGISSSNQLQIPRLPPTPTRIDRLIVDFFREHARVVTLLSRMEELRKVEFDENLRAVMIEWLDAIRLLQQRRLNERNAILNAVSNRINRVAVYYNEDKELISQTEALMILTQATIRARNANWCALILTIKPDSPIQQEQLETIQLLDYRCEPPEIPCRSLKT